MAEGLLPHFVDPGSSDDEMVVAFLHQEQEGHSARFHVEADTLMADREVPAALRLPPDVILVRRDLPEDLEPVREIIERVLASEGVELLDPETLLGVPVALQMVGLRWSSWDLWGRDVDQAFAALRHAATGDCALP